MIKLIEKVTPNPFILHSIVMKKMADKSNGWELTVLFKNYFNFFQPKNQSCVHLVCSRPTSHALQILRTLMTVAPKSARTNPDVVSLSISIAIFVDVKIRHFCGCFQSRNFAIFVDVLNVKAVWDCITFNWHLKDSSNMQMYLKKIYVLSCRNAWFYIPECKNKTLVWNFRIDI